MSVPGAALRVCVILQKRLSFSSTPLVSLSLKMEIRSYPTNRVTDWENKAGYDLTVLIQGIGESLQLGFYLGW